MGQDWRAAVVAGMWPFRVECADPTGWTGRRAGGTSMRRWWLAAVATVVVGGTSGIGVGVASATPGPGTYTTPFREDGAAFVDGAFQGGHYAGQPTDGNGCVAGPVSSAPDGN